MDSRFHEKKCKAKHARSAEMGGHGQKKRKIQDTELTNPNTFKQNRPTHVMEAQQPAKGIHRTAKPHKVTPQKNHHTHRNIHSGSYSASMTDRHFKHVNKQVSRKHKSLDTMNRDNNQQYAKKKGEHVERMSREESSDNGEDEDNGNDEEETDEDEYAEIKKELADIPLEDLVKIKEKMGLKAFTKILHGEKSREKVKTDFKRANKNRPMEMSSKRPVPMASQTAVPKKKVSRDPRFDDLSGEYKEEHFTRNYSFLSGIKAKEKQLLQKQLTKCKNEAKVKQLRFLLNRIGQQEQTAKQKEQQQEVESSWKQKERELVQEGKTPYFLKKVDKRKLELANKFRDLDKSGKVDNYLSKKRKKSAQKQRKKLPERQDMAV